MKPYESLVIFNPDLEESDLRQAVEKVQKRIEKGGKHVSVDEWGKRDLAYPVNKKKEGYYVLYIFDGPTTLPKELYRDYGLDETVMRGLIVRREEQTGPEEQEEEVKT